MTSPHRATAALLAATGFAAASAAASAADEPPARHLRCTLADGISVGVIHQGGRPLAVTAGAVAGARECATRSTAAARPSSAGWQLAWRDAASGDGYLAELRALPGGGFGVTLSQPLLPRAGTEPAPQDTACVRCGSLRLRARAELRPGDTGCTEREDRSEALQAAWRLLRQALLANDGEAFRSVAAAQIELAEGASEDSRSVPASTVAQHLRCIAGLTRGGQTLADWATKHPHLPTAPTGVAWQGEGEVTVAGQAGLSWQAGAWKLSWLNASPAVVLRDCAP